MVTSQEYDDAGRAYKTIDPKGLESRLTFDDLGRTTKSIENYVDGTVSDADDKTVEYEYGPAGMTKLRVLLTGGGEQTTETVYGVSQSTGDEFDSFDAVKQTKHPDASTGLPSSSETDTVTVNALGEALTSTDRNGTEHEFAYDILGRPISDTASTLGTNIDGSVRRIETAYDGQGNAYLITSYDSVSGGTIVNQVQRDFNGLGQMTSEWQEHDGAKDGSTLRVQYEYSFNPTGSNNHSRPEGMTYPDGTVMDYNYAANVDGRISRISSTEVVSHSLLEEYDYLGYMTVIKRIRAGTIRSDVTLSYVKLTGESNGDAGDKYTGLDRFGRVVDQRWWRVGGGSNVDRYQYTYDRDSNRTARTNVVNTNLNETYGYDGLNQLTSFAVTGTSKSWDYDATGNWDGVTTNSVTESRTHNKQNELLTATSQTSPTYDSAGNQTTDFSGRTFVYDAWNRTKQVDPSGGGSALRTYELDGLGRRIEETTGSDTTDFYYSSGWQLIEERVDDEPFAQYMWSGAGYVDEMIVRYRDADGNSGNGLEERLWVLQDANYNVTGLVTNSGTVLERYSYDPYGMATVYDASWTVRTGGSSYGWNYGHQGLRWDGTTGKHHARNRDFDPAQGRWTSSDPLGFVSGDPNLFGFVGNDPIASVDPYGLQLQDMRSPFPKSPLTGGGPISTSRQEKEFGGMRSSGIRAKLPTKNPNIEYFSDFGFVDWTHANTEEPSRVIKAVFGEKNVPPFGNYVPKGYFRIQLTIGGILKASAHKWVI